MAQIIPRWEWRTFGKRIDTAIDPGTYPRTRHVESSEIYLVSSTSEANPKIRDAKLDIKSLQRTNENGLEQWKPAMKASFPITGDEVKDTFRALNLPAPVCDQDTYTLDAFLAVIGAEARAVAVPVDKVRDQYDVDGCSVEVADVTIDGNRFRTVAVEDPDPQRVTTTLGKLGLSGRENISYVKMLKTLKGLTPDGSKD